MRSDFIRAVAVAMVGLVLFVLPTAALSPVLAQQAPQEAPQIEPEYVIVPGDTIQILVLGESDLTRTITVRPDGMINLPLVGDLVVAGKTSAQASAMITEALLVYLKQPVVTVTVTSFAVRPRPRVMVLGSVRSPGPYEIFTGARVIDAIVLAGWTVDRATLDSVGLIRRGKDGQLAVTKVNLDRILDGKGDLAQNVPLQNTDIVYVPRDNRVQWRDVLSWISGLSLIRNFFGLP